METQYGGMTVNERLSASKQLEAFDTAVKNHNEAEVKSILASVEVDERSIKAIIDKML